MQGSLSICLVILHKKKFSNKDGYMMHHYTLLALLFFAGGIIHAQQDESFRLYQVGIEVGSYKAKSAENRGLESTLIATFKQRKNIYELNLSTGVVGDFGKEQDPFLLELFEIFTPRFLLISAYYGKEIPLVSKLNLVPQAGVSLVYSNDKEEIGIGLPLKLRLEYQGGKFWKIGLSNNYLLSDIDNKLSFNFFFGILMQ